MRDLLKFARKGGDTIMRQYRHPAIVEYGRMEHLTLGQHGSLPDFNLNGQVVANNNCSEPEVGPGESGNSNPFECGIAS